MNPSLDYTFFGKRQGAAVVVIVGICALATITYCASVPKRDVFAYRLLLTAARIIGI